MEVIIKEVLTKKDMAKWVRFPNDLYKNDKNRDIAPAIPADDAIIFDNSVMTVEESVKEIVRLVNERK